MHRYLLLACVDDRPDMLKTCLASIKAYLSDWKLLIVAQEFDEHGWLADEAPEALIFYQRHRLGMHNAKAIGLNYLHALHPDGDYIVASIDDDMEFLPETDWSGPETILAEKGVGLVSAGWVQNETALAKQRGARPQFIRQPIVYTGGGLLFTSEVADIIRQLPRADYLCDNSEWSLAVYLAGYENYRFRGSLTIHRIRRAGGRKGWVDLKERQRPDECYLPFRPAKTGGPNAYHIGDSKDLTDAAHDLHNQNRKNLL